MRTVAPTPEAAEVIRTAVLDPAPEVAVVVAAGLKAAPEVEAVVAQILEVAVEVTLMLSNKILIIYTQPTYANIILFNGILTNLT